MNSEKLKKHMRCLFTYGGMYLVSNSNLLYHASVPLNEDGSFKHVKIRGKEYWGRKLLDKADQLIRTAYFDEEGEDDKEFAMDYIWYMWCGPEAPLFDKDKMATFERYFLEDKEMQKEKKDIITLFAIVKISVIRYWMNLEHWDLIRISSTVMCL